MTEPFDLKWLQTVRAIHETTQGHRLLHGAQETETYEKTFTLILETTETLHTEQIV